MIEQIGAVLFILWLLFVAISGMKETWHLVTSVVSLGLIMLMICGLGVFVLYTLIVLFFWYAVKG